MMRPAIVLLLFALAASAADRFEIATLKQSPPITTDTYPITLGLIRNNRLDLTNTTLADCIKYAWSLVSDDQISGPAWTFDKNVRFDIVAQIPPGTSDDQVRVMTQQLLADRLGLAVHHEPREHRYLSLTVAKNGPKMPPADTSQTRQNSGGSGHMTGNRVSTLLIATLLSRLEHELIIDNTGLKGEFQVKLIWAKGTADPAAPPDDSGNPPLFSAIQDQLGLRLEPGRGPIDVIVIDQASQTPADN